MLRSAKFLAAAAFCAICSLFVSQGETLPQPGGTVARKGDGTTNAVKPVPEIVAANEGLYSKLKSFICAEHIERFASKKRGDPERHLDTLSAQVSFENGQEHYSAVKRNGQKLAGLSSVAGAWSEGEFGTLLRQTEDLLRTAAVQFDGGGEISGIAVSRVHFDVPERDSPWDLEVAGRHYRVPFRTEVWVGKASGEIFRIIRRSTGEIGDTKIAALEWSVTLGPVDLSGGTWLLPKDGEYVVTYANSGRREWNELSFSNYHRYGAEVALRFDGQE